MSLRRLAILSLVAALALPSAAFAQIEDDLLNNPDSQPVKPKGKTKPAKPKAVKRKPTTAAKKPPRKGKPGKPVVTPAEVPEDLPATLTLRLTNVARGARISVNGKDLNNPQAPLELPPGTYTVVARRQNYTDFSQQVLLEPGKSAELQVSLELSVGFVSMRSEVARTEVWVDKRSLGFANIDNHALPPGSHTIEFRVANELRDVQNLKVTAGQVYVVNAQLRPMPAGTPPVVAAAPDAPRATTLEPKKTAGPVEQPGLALGTEQPPEVKESTSKAWYQRWYVWVGVGAVAAAAGAGAYMATRPADALDPDKDVCGGSGCDAVIGIRGARLPLPANALRF